MYLFFFFFFFSSRRRHTRLQGDWSSDVCSSDLDLPGEDVAARRAARDVQVARAPQIEQVDPRAGKGLHPAKVQIIEDRDLDCPFERGLGAGVGVKVPVLEAEQPGQVDRVLLEAVRPRAPVEPAV